MTESMPATGPGGPTGRSLALRAAIVGGGAIAAVGLLYGVSLALTGSDIPRGTKVLGVSVGGSSVDGGAARLAADLPGVLPQQMSLLAGDRTLSRSTSDLGLAIDYAATAAHARSGWASPLRSIPALFGAGHDVDPVAGVDQAKLASGVEAMNSEITTNFVEGGLTFDTGVAVAVKPVRGRGLDTSAAQGALERAYLDGGAQVEGKIIDLFPAVDEAAVQRALEGMGAKAVSGPVTIKVAKSLVELQPSEFGRFLSTVPDNGELRLVVDAEGLVANLQTEVEDLGRKPRDARFTFTEDDKVEIVPSKPGVTLDVAVLTDELADTLTGDGPRTVDAGAKTEEPDFTTEDAEALGITEKMGSFKTYYPIAPYRITNIGRAAELINGSIVKPDEIWSLNDTVGERTVKNGFVRGFIIKQGVFVEDLGGGVSQSATTTFNAVFFSGLKDVEHHPHSLYIGRYPAGREATVAFGSKDLRFQNDSGRGVYIQAKAVPGSIEVTMWGTKVYGIESISGPRRNITSPKSIESTDEDCMDQAPADGFDITVTRVFKQKGEEVKRENFDTHYDPTDKITCVDKNKPTASPSPSASGSPKPIKAKTPSPSPTPSSSGPPGAVGQSRGWTRHGPGQGLSG